MEIVVIAPEVIDLSKFGRQMGELAEIFQASNYIPDARFAPPVEPARWEQIDTGLIVIKLGDERSAEQLFIRVLDGLVNHSVTVADGRGQVLFDHIVPKP